MKKIILTMIALCCCTFAFDSVEVSSPDITLHKYGYFKTDKNITEVEALKYSAENQLLLLPQKAVSFGFDKNTYWFRFDVSTAGGRHFILDVKNLVADSCELFVFDGGKQIRHEVSGYAVPPQNRPFDSINIKFNLEENKPSITYLVKISSTNPHYTAFEFGTEEEVSKKWSILIYTTIVAFAICAVMIFYNLALFLAVKDTTYIYYCLYISSYFAFNICALGFLPLISPFFTSIEPRVPIGLSLQIMYLGLTLFTIKFLHLETNDPKLKKQLLYVLYFMLISTLLVPLDKGFELVAVFSMAAIAFFLVYGVAKTYIKGYKPALLYLIATGVAIICNMTFMNMNQNGGVPYNIWTFNLVSFGLIWDMFFLSFAIAHRIKLIYEEKEQAQKTVAAKARFAVIGETIGNIAHQWRQPLAQLSSINASLDFGLKFNGKIENEKLHKSIESSSQIIEHLSGTIDTFQNFFAKHGDESFDACVCINDALCFMEGMFEQRSIKVTLSTDGKEAIVKGCREEFFHAILVILNNAKDALIDNETINPTIDTKLVIADSKVTITFKDNGGGIKLENIEEIFEPYTSTKGLNGMGIGLFTAKSIIEDKMGGEISAKNTKDGARFTITLQTA